jgi:hypothetical protein
LAQAGKKRNSSVSPAIVNRKLRHIKAALRVAYDYGYIAKVPKFRWAKEPDRIG